MLAKHVEPRYCTIALPASPLMRLNPGVSLAYADDVLRRAESQWSNAQGSDDFYNDYVKAVNETYPLLKQAFAVPDLGGGLHSTAYWNLIKIGRDQIGPSVFTDPAMAASVWRALRAENYALSTEIRIQLSALQQARRDFEDLKRLANRPGLPIVYDTNMLNHWQQPGGIRWEQVLKHEGLSSGPVRLVVPLQVVDELDRQKYGQGDLAKRAATAIRYLERVLRETAPGEAVEVRPGASLEVWMPTDDRGRDVDLSILECATDLDGLRPDAGARVLTGDLNMRLRARQMGLKTLSLTEDYRKPGSAALGVPEASIAPED